MTGTTFAERLNLAIGENVHAFARRANLSDSTLRQYLKGSMPGLDKLIAISEASGVTLDWLAADRGPMRQSSEDRVDDLVVYHANGTPILIQLKTGKAGKKAELTLVPRFNVSASAGSGQIAYQEQAVELIAFQSAWLRSIGISPDFARIITARGDSMEPTIRDGDQILIDTSVSEVRDNGIYCVVYGDMMLVKRVHPRMNGSLQLISDNDVYPPEEVSVGDVPSLSIAGRVRWFGRNL